MPFGRTVSLPHIWSVLISNISNLQDDGTTVHLQLLSSFDLYTIYMYLLCQLVATYHFRFHISCSILYCLDFTLLQSVSSQEILCQARAQLEPSFFPSPNWAQLGNPIFSNPKLPRSDNPCHFEPEASQAHILSLPPSRVSQAQASCSSQHELRPSCYTLTRVKISENK